jgi:hypothetical protein
MPSHAGRHKGPRSHRGSRRPMSLSSSHSASRDLSSTAWLTNKPRSLPSRASKGVHPASSRTISGQRPPVRSAVGDYRAGDGLYAGYTPRPVRLIIIPERVTVPAPRLFYVAPAGGALRSRCPARTRRAGQRRPAREYPAEPAPTGLSWWPSMTLGSSRVCRESDRTVMRPGQPVPRQALCPRHRALWPVSGAAVRGPSG